MLEDSGGVVKRYPFRQKEMVSGHKTSNDKMVRGYGLDRLGICVTLVEVFVSGPTAATKGREGGGSGCGLGPAKQAAGYRYARNLR